MLMIVMVHLTFGIDWGFSVDPTAAIEAYTKTIVYISETLVLKVGFRIRRHGKLFKNHIPKYRKIYIKSR